MIATLHIQTALRNHKTYLKSVYQTTPFKIANITEDKNLSTLHLMVMSSSPGILDEDLYNIDVHVSEGCSVVLHTQSFQRLFKMEKGAAQNTRIQVSNNASFCYIPHPTVPHEASDFTATNLVYLNGNSQLIWAEVLTCGRKLSGEVFKFSRFVSLTKIYHNDRLVVKEHLRMQPSVVDVHALGQLEGYTHQASFIYINTNKSAALCTQAAQVFLQECKDIEFGISALPIPGFIVRILGFKGDQLYTILQQLGNVIASSTTPTLTTPTTHYAG